MKKEEKGKKKSFFSNFNDNTSKLAKFDFAVMGILVLIYALLAFTNLGSTKAPKTYYHFENEGSNVSLELKGDKQQISKMRYYTGVETGSFAILTSVDGETFEKVGDFTTNSSFAWEEYSLDSEFKYIKFMSNRGDIYLGDVQFYDSYGKKVEAVASNEQSKVVVDELDLVPIRIGYKNSTYFDEIYFARSAYEYTHGLNAMEWVHPPLGKLLMAIPVLLFGFSPFSIFKYTFS